MPSFHHIGGVEDEHCYEYHIPMKTSLSKAMVFDSVDDVFDQTNCRLFISFSSHFYSSLQKTSKNQNNIVFLPNGHSADALKEKTLYVIQAKREEDLNEIELLRERLLSDSYLLIFASVFYARAFPYAEQLIIRPQMLSLSLSDFLFHRTKNRSNKFAFHRSFFFSFRLSKPCFTNLLTQKRTLWLLCSTGLIFISCFSILSGSFFGEDHTNQATSNEIVTLSDKGFRIYQQFCPSSLGYFSDNNNKLKQFSKMSDTGYETFMAFDQPLDQSLPVSFSYLKNGVKTLYSPTVISSFYDSTLMGINYVAQNDNKYLNPNGVSYGISISTSFADTLSNFSDEYKGCSYPEFLGKSIEAYLPTSGSITLREFTISGVFSETNDHYKGLFENDISICNYSLMVSGWSDTSIFVSLSGHYNNLSNLLFQMCEISKVSSFSFTFLDNEKGMFSQNRVQSVYKEASDLGGQWYIWLSVSLLIWLSTELTLLFIFFRFIFVIPKDNKYGYISAMLILHFFDLFVASVLAIGLYSMLGFFAIKFNPIFSYMNTITTLLAFTLFLSIDVVLYIVFSFKMKVGYERTIL